jgi:Co/Zn/Cd efflux system component
MNIRGAFLHVLNDALGSVIVVLAGVFMKIWPDKAWVNYIDPLASLLMISMIIVFTIPLCKSSEEKKHLIEIFLSNLVRETALVLLQTVPMHIEVADLQKRLVEKVNRFCFCLS